MKKTTVTFTLLSKEPLPQRQYSDIIEDAFTDTDWSMVVRTSEKVENITDDQAKELLEQGTGLEPEDYPFGLVTEEAEEVE